MNLWRYLADFAALIFPDLCPACNTALASGEKVICTRCRYDLPFTNFHLQMDNIVARQFWGKLTVEAAYALFYFSKGGKVQNLVHNLKYKNMPHIGNVLGSIAGSQLLINPIFATVDYIIPVPLHNRRLKQRGYNQSTRFAEGLSLKLNVPVSDNNLIRTKHTATQTKKSRFSRFENMKDIFDLKHPELLKGKHILLVDDTVTTGSTLEACGIELLKIQGVTVSIATIAYAE